MNVEQTVRLIKHRQELGTELKISHVILRFLLSGLVILLYLDWNPTGFSWAGLLLLLAVIGMALSFIEQYIEIRVLEEPENWAFRWTTATRVFLAITSPILFFPLLILRSLTAEPQRFYSVTEDELKKLLDASEEEGVLEVDERKMIHSIFQFREKLAREIMIPRIDIIALNVTTQLLDAMDVMLTSGFSRVPVYQESIDNITGVLYIKDLLRLCRDGQSEGGLQDKLRPVYFVPETKKVDHLLTEMQNSRTHIAVVVDEYGGVAGIVTLEDIVEEIVGEIQDEYDQAEEQIYQKLNEGEYIFQARIDLDDFNKIMDTDLSKDDADTLGGLIYNKMGRVPKGGEVIQTEGIILTVEQISGRRIRKIKVCRTDLSSPKEIIPHAH